MPGTNVNKLIAWKMSRDAVPTGGGIADAVKFLINPTGIGESARAASKWVADAIIAIRNAVEPNPWKTADDEAIAAEIIRTIQERKK